MKLKINKATVSFLLATALFTPVISGITNSFFGIIKTETAFAENGALSYINYDENEIQVTEDYSALVGAATATSVDGGYWASNRNIVRLGAMKRQLDDGKSGLLLSSVKSGVDAEGTSVSFASTLYDDFSMDFRVFSQESYEGFFSAYANEPTDDRYNPFLDLKEVGIKITSASDPTQSFTIDVHGSAAWYVPNVCVSAYVEGEKFTSGVYRGYGIKTDDNAQRANYATNLKGTSFVNASTNELNECTSISVDMDTLRVYGISREVEHISSTPAVTEKKVLVRDLVNNVNPAGIEITGAVKTLSPEDFKDGYYVSVEFNDVTSNETELRKTKYNGTGDGFFTTCETVPLYENTQTVYERKANMIIYSLNGQNFEKNAGFSVDTKTDVYGTAPYNNGQGGEEWSGDVLRLHTIETGMKAEGASFNYAGVKTETFEQAFAVYTWQTNHSFYTAASSRFCGGNGLEDDQNPQPVLKQVAFDFTSVSNPEAKFTLFIRSNGTSGNMIIPEARVAIPSDKIYTNNYEKGYGLKDGVSFSGAMQTQIDGGFKGTSINGNYNVSTVKFDATEMKVYGVRNGEYVLIRDLANNVGTDIPSDYCASLSADDFAQGYKVSFRICDVTRDGLGAWANRNPAEVAKDLNTGRVYNKDGTITASSAWSYEFDEIANPTRKPDIWFAGMTTEDIDGLNVSSTAEYNKQIPMVRVGELIKDIECNLTPTFGGVMSVGARISGTITYVNGEETGNLLAGSDGNYSFTPKSYGTYTLIIPIEWDGKIINLEQKVRVKDVVAPQIALKDDLLTTWTYSESETKPHLSADDVVYSDDSGICEVEISAKLNKKNVPLNEVFEKSGVYEITYTAFDEFFNKSSVTRVFTVYEKDGDAPVISVYGGNRSVKIGEQVSIPEYACFDNYDGEVSCVIEVYFGEQKVEIQDSKFVATKEGEYKIVYSATDSNGNIAKKEIVIKAEVEGEVGSGCSSSVPFAGGFVALTILGIGVLLKKKKD